MQRGEHGFDAACLDTTLRVRVTRGVHTSRAPCLATTRRARTQSGVLESRQQRQQRREHRASATVSRHPHTPLTQRSCCLPYRRLKITALGRMAHNGNINKQKSRRILEYAMRHPRVIQRGATGETGSQRPYTGAAAKHSTSEERGEWERKKGTDRYRVQNNRPYLCASSCLVHQCAPHKCKSKIWRNKSQRTFKSNIHSLAIFTEIILRILPKQSEIPIPGFGTLPKREHFQNKRK